jgi:hypothetical protein
VNLLAEVAGYWPLLLLPALFPLARWVYRRDQIAHPSIDQASHERGPVPGQEEDK